MSAQAPADLKAFKKTLGTALVGLSLSPTLVEAVALDAKTLEVLASVAQPLPEGLIEPESFVVSSSMQLASLLVDVIKELGVKPFAKVYLTISGGLVRVVDLSVSVEGQDLYLALSTEAERYRLFQDSEAMVSYAVLDRQEGVGSGGKRLLFSAVRSDAQKELIQALRASRLSVHAVDVQDFCVLRAMAATGVLDGLMAQIGPDSLWGGLFLAHDRARFYLFKGNALLDLRELQMNTSSLMDDAQLDSVAVEDLALEINRTIQPFDSKPAFWFGLNVGASAIEQLSQLLAVPFNSCFVPPELLKSSASHVGLAVFGAACKGKVNFPFGINLLEARSSLAKGSAPSSSVGFTGGALMEKLTPFMPMILVAAGVVGVLYVSLLFLSTKGQGDLSALEKEREGLKTELASLSTEEKNWQQKLSAFQALQQEAKRIRNHNNGVILLGQLLSHKTPPGLWFYEVNLTQRVELKGDALSQQQVVDFSNALDQDPSVNHVELQTLEQQLFGSRSGYQFVLSASLPEGKEEVTPAASSETVVTPPAALTPPAAP